MRQSTAFTGRMTTIHNHSVRLRPQVTPTCVLPATLRLRRRTRRRYYNYFLPPEISETLLQLSFLPEPKNIQNPFISQAIRYALSYRAELIAASLTQLDQPLLSLFRCGTFRLITVPFPSFRCGTRPNIVYLTRSAPSL